MELGSPLSTQHYLGSATGEIYGLRHSADRFSPLALAELRPRTDVPGLWLTGPFAPIRLAADSLETQRLI